ncbi:MAG: hypothetical protein ACRENJ_11895 [Candidatus Eiseniibacteriota bacterium]
MTRHAPTVAGLLAAALALAMPVRPAAAGSPPPLATSLFAFPGSTTHPASAASAGLALADRWLGDDPFSNPASPPAGLALSGAVLHVSRQDLRAGNRDFDETPAFFDGAGFAVGGARGPLGVSLYAFQPTLRREANAFSRGTATPDPGAPPAAIEATASARELRAGGGVSLGIGAGCVGVGVEWTRREDAYEVIERSGSPTAGTTRLELAGDAVGFQIGGRLGLGDSSVGGITIGVGLRRLPRLAVDAPLSQPEALGLPDTTLLAEREPGWELGTSARIAVSPSFRVLAAVGGATAQHWEGFDLSAGRAWEWKLAGEFHDTRDPWTLRFGLGQERQADAAERRADVLSLGYGWAFAWGQVDVGIAHRTLARATGPRSYEDRVVLTWRTAR